VIVPVDNTDCDEDSEEDLDSEEALPTNYESDAISTSTDVSCRNKESDSLATEWERLKKELEETQAKFKAAEFSIDALSHDEHYYTGFKSYKRFKACFDFFKVSSLQFELLGF